MSATRRKRCDGERARRPGGGSLHADVYCDGIALEGYLVSAFARARRSAHPDGDGNAESGVLVRLLLKPDMDDRGRGGAGGGLSSFKDAADAPHPHLPGGKRAMARQ